VSTTLRERPATGTVTDGGVPARRALIRWALRLFRREWRQQILVMIMLAVAVAAMILGAGVATNTPLSSPSVAQFGTAHAMITLPGTDPHLAADVAALKARYRTVNVIENQNLNTGLVQPVQLRAQNPFAPYGSPLISLVSGHYPAGPGQTAVTAEVATRYGLHTGGTWRIAGRAFLVTGVVENPSNLLDEFALVRPGQLTAPTQVTILLGTDNVATSGLPAGANVSYASLRTSSVNPATIVLVVAILGLVFVGLVGVAGFSVMAQRRLRALGMLSALGATERNVRLVMVADGAVVGLVATIVGAAAGLGAWFLYVPHLEQATAHRIDPANLPWWAVITGMILAVATAVLAARRPARTAARIPVVEALSGRPPVPTAVHRSAGPGVIAIAGGACLLAFSDGWSGSGGQDTLFLLGGLIAMVVGSLLLAPLCIALLATAVDTRAPVAVRLALRDLIRYRARSGAALAAASFAVFLAMLICIVAGVRFSNVLDYTGDNLTTSQLIVYAPGGNGGGGPGQSIGQAPTQAQINALHARVDSFAAGLHAQYVLPLASGGVSLMQIGRQNNNFSGQIYVATPALLHEYGIKLSQFPAGTDFLTSRAGLQAEPHMLLVFGGYFNGKGGPPGGSYCPARTCRANPGIAYTSALPTGVDAPNTVITPAALRSIRQRTGLQGWLIQAPHPLTNAQINAASALAVANGTAIETKSGQLSLGEISDGATAIGLLIAFGVLAMSVGLIRSETAGELRTLTATGATSRTRRTLTATTAGALGLLAALLGTATAALAGLSWARSSLSTTFGGVPPLDWVLVLVGLPLIAAAGGWLLAGREPSVITRQPLE
jgi:putative ABC transport system permease protein